MLHSHRDNNHPPAAKVPFLSPPLLPGWSSSMAWLCVYCSSVVLQAQQVWPGFGNPGREPDGFMTQVLHAWLTCQLQVSKAQPDWFSLPLSLSPLVFWLHLGLRMEPGLDWSARPVPRCVQWHLPWWRQRQHEIKGKREMWSREGETVAGWNVRLLVGCLADWVGCWQTI